MQPMPEDWERAVAVVAHPDDLEYGVASAVARCTTLCQCQPTSPSTSA